MPSYTTSASFLEGTPLRPTAAPAVGLLLSTPPRAKVSHSGHASSEEASPFSSERLATLTCTPPFPHAPPFPRSTGSSGCAANAAADFCWARGALPCQNSPWYGSDASAAPRWLGPDVDVETPDKLKLKSRAAPLDVEEVKRQLRSSMNFHKEEVPSCADRQDMVDLSSARLRAEAAEFVPWADTAGFQAASTVDTKITAAEVQAAVSSELVAVENQKAAFPSIPPPLPESLTAAVSHLAEIEGATLVMPAQLPSGMLTMAPEQLHLLPTVETSPPAPDDGAVLAAIDNIFEPFALQHNSHLLLAIARQLGKMHNDSAAGTQSDGWPWTCQALARVAFSTEDLAQCASKSLRTKLVTAGLLELTQIHKPELSELRHLCWVDGAWRLRSPPEIRCFLSAPNAMRSLVAATTRAILGRSSPPPKVVTVLSYSVSKMFQDQAADGDERWQRLMQQLRACHTDILCLQGFQPKTDAGKALAMSLKADGFAYAAAAPPQGGTSCTQANAIFWDQRRWEATCEPRGYGHEGCAALLVELRLREDPATAVRVASVQPQLVDCCDSTLGQALNAPQSAPSSWSPGDVRSFPTARAAGSKNHATLLKQQMPLVVCTDLSALGGAESAALVPGLLGLRSAMVEATGEELASPLRGASASDKDAQQTFRLRPLCRHDAVLFRDLTRVLVLSGHTEGYLTTMSDDELRKQFPAGRLPIVAGFSLAE